MRTSTLTKSITWTPRTERLPDDLTYVLVAHESGSVIPAWYAKDTWTVEAEPYNKTIRPENVLYWAYYQPLHPDAEDEE